MKLEKIKEASGTNNKGHVINCYVGGRKYSSWWSSPPKTLDHADMGYLKDRYSIIRTEKRAQEFKRLYKLLWIEVTPIQRRLMEHCLGLDHNKKPYRNRYISRKNDDWEWLTIQGLAERMIFSFNEQDTTYMYYLNKLGVEFVLGGSIKAKTYSGFTL